MDNINQKNIDIHMSTKVQSEMVDLVKSLYSQGKITQAQMVTLEQVAADGDESSEQGATEKKEATQKTKSGEAPNDKVVHEANKSKTYNRLLLEGHRERGVDHEKQLLAILNEVEGGEELLKNLKAMNNPAPVPSTDFDETFLQEIETEPEYDEEDESEGSDEDEDCEEEADEEDLSLKETDPGYFKSLLVKI